MFANESRPQEFRQQILIVDRDLGAIEPLRQKLLDAEFAVHAISDGAAAIAAMTERPPRLAIIDGSMPGHVAMDLVARARQARVAQAVRLIVLSASADEQDVVTWLELGADDCVAKPYLLRELVARVSAILRSRAHEHQTLRYDELVLEASSNRLTAHGRPVDLRGIEYRLLEFLMAHPGRTFNRTQLLAEVWREQNVDERTVDVNVQRLRKILRQLGYDTYLQTVRGFGYRLAPPSLQ